MRLDSETGESRCAARFPTCAREDSGNDKLMSWDEELWGVALAVTRMHGDRAPVFVAARIGALALEGDAAGVAAWKRVASNLDELHRGAGAPC